MDNLYTRISLRLEGHKHSLHSSDSDFNGTKELFENITGLGQAQYLNLKRLKIGQSFQFLNKSFIVSDIEIQYCPENQFGLGEEESLDIHIIIKEQK